jgi:mono/diheme cytochrome c family protein
MGLLVGCAQNMRNSSRIKPYEPSTFFENGQSAQPLIPGTVARGEARTDEQFYTGMVSETTPDETGNGEPSATATATDEQGGEPGATTTADQAQSGAQGNQAQAAGTPVEEFPFPITREIVERGQNRYNIYCAPCHAITGNGDGMIVQRGFSPPPSFHSDRLRDAPVGYYYDVITNGFGRMYSYSSRIQPADRWAIIAYIRALQLSQNAPANELPAEDRAQVEGAGQ